MITAPQEHVSHAIRALILYASIKVTAPLVGEIEFALVRVEHHAQDAVDPQPRVPETYDHIPIFWGGPSNGERCDVCEVLIADTVIEGISSEVTGRKAPSKCTSEPRSWPLFYCTSTPSSAVLS